MDVFDLIQIVLGIRFLIDLIKIFAMRKCWFIQCFNSMLYYRSIVNDIPSIFARHHIFMWRICTAHTWVASTFKIWTAYCIHYRSQDWFEAFLSLSLSLCGSGDSQYGSVGSGNVKLDILCSFIIIKQHLTSRLLSLLITYNYDTIESNRSSIHLAHLCPKGIAMKKMN